MFYPEITEVKRNILVLDDDESVCKFLKTALSESYSVATAETGRKAIELTVDTVFNLALVDVGMVGMNGFEFLAYCKKHCPAMNVILMTGHPDVKDAINSIKEGALDYIGKPIDLHNLNVKINLAFANQENQIKSPDEQILNSSFFQMEEYRVLKTLGAGNGGIVLLVEKDGSRYAMKIVRKKGSPEQHELSVKRFLRESDILKGMRHQNIVRVYRSDILPDIRVPFIIMEYIDGFSLSEYIAKSVMNIELRIGIFKQLASALDYIHKLGVVHRDIKPDNIMMTRDIQVKITDFGISKTQESLLTRTNDIMGSPHYMAPESYDSAMSIDNKADIFSLGSICYELLTCQRAFPGDNIFQVMEAIKSKKPVEPRKLNPDIPSWLQYILEKMMAKNPEGRYSTAGKIIESIEFHQQNDGTQVFPQDSRTSRLLRGMMIFDNKWS
jgi:serine/threonine protein kinase